MVCVTKNDFDATMGYDKLTESAGIDQRRCARKGRRAERGDLLVYPLISAYNNTYWLFKICRSFINPPLLQL